MQYLVRLVLPIFVIRIQQMVQQLSHPSCWPPTSTNPQTDTVASFDLKSPSGNGLRYLRDYHTFGRRKDTVDTQLDFAYVSKFHAVIEWREPDWLLKDVSRNGIKLNDKIIPAQQPVVLKVGDTIDFAGVGEAVLTIRDISPPEPMLINQAMVEEIIPIPESSLLPNETNPELAVYRCPDREQWFAESVSSGEEIGPFDHGDAIDFDGKRWTFFLITEDDATKEFNPQQTTLADVLFRFDLSQDEESTHLRVTENGVTHDLGERSHHYLLLHLLRHRQSQSPDTGWLDTQLLLKQLGLEETYMNIQIFRARRQVTAALPGVTGQSQLIERRRGALRTNIVRFEVYKEGVREELALA